VILKALIIYPNARIRDYGDLLQIARADGKRAFQTDENVVVKAIVWVAECNVWVALCELPQSFKTPRYKELEKRKESEQERGREC